MTQSILAELISQIFKERIAALQKAFPGENRKVEVLEPTKIGDSHYFSIVVDGEEFEVRISKPDGTHVE